nr:GGDEF domain-containing phosphodiesterase [Phascolarctobacterium sp.]
MEEIYQPSVQRYLQVKSILFNYMGRRLRFEILYNFKEEELEQQKKYLDQKLEQIRWVDNLTGLYNREKYSSLLKDIEIKKIRQIGIVDMDINGLRNINATKGYHSGDRVLIRMATLIKSVFGINSFRVGSDEFVSLSLNTGKAEFEAKVTELKAKFSAETDFRVSVGSLWSDNCRDIYKKVSQANAVMEATKSFGYKNLAADYNHKAESAHRLLDKIAAGRFKVYLQPKINLQTGMLEGAEALIRKIDGHGNVIAPDNFIPCYEDIGLINYIDTFVLKTVCQLLKKWRDQGDKLFKVSVNVSRVTLIAEDIIKDGVAICREYGIDPGLIDVEITESFGLLEKELLVDLIKRMHEAGFSISMDDFGTSFSNLELLSQVHFDTVKFDKSLVDTIVINPKAQILFKAAVSMCREFGDTLTLAEGVETEEQLKVLQKLGCQLGQGYYFARPLPAEEFWERYVKKKA